MAVAALLVHAFSTALFFLPLFGLGGLVDEEVVTARFLARDLRLGFAGDPLLAVLQATVLQGYDGLQLGFLLASVLFTWANALMSGKARAARFTPPEKIFLYATPLKMLWYSQASAVEAFVVGVIKYLEDVAKACVDGPALECFAAPVVQAPVSIEDSTLGLLKVVGVGIGISIVGGLVVMIGGHKQTMEFPSNLASSEPQLKAETPRDSKSGTASRELPPQVGDVAEEDDEEEEDEEERKRREVEAEREAMNHLSYAELRDWAKSVGIRANQKKADLIEALLDLDDEGDMDEIDDAPET
uniref:SAP domain-containing protein n=1 Tax=Pinguiococcus pyrenoidosus TaxID=172671 RepID=A0A7R9YD81_9STRA|mmetsp:Transcript_229/g.953  ORF Transcript_229/g.953 Transcript_229/m.953 type:complete len:300 (+) Transcript_229:176-1075(+)